ncbi:hypothetical protein FF38_06329, partial [Lucilia cuprina]
GTAVTTPPRSSPAGRRTPARRRCARACAPPGPAAAHPRRRPRGAARRRWSNAGRRPRRNETIAPVSGAGLRPKSVAAGRGERGTVLRVLVVGVPPHHDAGRHAELRGHEGHGDRVLLVVADHLLAAEQRRDAGGAMTGEGEDLVAEAVAEEALRVQVALEGPRPLDGRLGARGRLRREVGDLLGDAALLRHLQRREGDIRQGGVAGLLGHDRLDRVGVALCEADRGDRGSRRIVEMGRAGELGRPRPVEGEVADGTDIRHPHAVEVADLHAHGRRGARRGRGHVRADRRERAGRAGAVIRDVVHDAVVRIHRRQSHPAVLGQPGDGEQRLVGVVADVAAERLQRTGVLRDIERRNDEVAQDVPRRGRHGGRRDAR